LGNLSVRISFSRIRTLAVSAACYSEVLAPIFTIEQGWLSVSLVGKSSPINTIIILKILHVAAFAHGNTGAFATLRFELNYSPREPATKEQLDLFLLRRFFGCLL
jgi:hypothetical protein